MNAQTQTQQVSMQDQLRHAEIVQQRYTESLLRLPHVIGVGIGFAREHGIATNEIALIIMVDEKIPVDQLDLERLIPKQLDGVRVDVQPAGGMFMAG